MQIPFNIRPASVHIIVRVIYFYSKALNFGGKKRRVATAWPYFREGLDDRLDLDDYMGSRLRTMGVTYADP